MERGKSYTFIVSGGDDRSNEGEYHPFYITDSIMGGRLLFTTDERAVSWFRKLVDRVISVFIGDYHCTVIASAA